MKTRIASIMAALGVLAALVVANPAGVAAKVRTIWPGSFKLATHPSESVAKYYQTNAYILVPSGALGDVPAFSAAIPLPVGATITGLKAAGRPADSDIAVFVVRKPVESDEVPMLADFILFNGSGDWQLAPLSFLPGEPLKVMRGFRYYVSVALPPGTELGGIQVFYK